MSDCVNSLRKDSYEASEVRHQRARNAVCFCTACVAASTTVATSDHRSVG